MQCADVPVRAAKVRGGTLPPELELSRFLGDVHNLRSSWSVETPIHKWEGVRCNEEGNVEEISWPTFALRGTIHQWSYLPSTLRVLCLGPMLGTGNELEGKLITEDLPRQVKRLVLSNNNFTGPVNFEAIPADVVKFDLFGNSFSGEVIFNNLPSRLEYFDLGRNEFSGKVCMAHLPHSLTVMDLSRNNFSGTLEMTSLCPKIKVLYLNHNRFTGIVDLSKLPSTLVILQLFGNSIQVSDTYVLPGCVKLGDPNPMVK